MTDEHKLSYETFEKLYGEKFDGLAPKFYNIGAKYFITQIIAVKPKLVEDGDIYADPELNSELGFVGRSLYLDTIFGKVYYKLMSTKQECISKAKDFWAIPIRLAIVTDYKLPSINTDVFRDIFDRLNAGVLIVEGENIFDVFNESNDDAWKDCVVNLTQNDIYSIISNKFKEFDYTVETMVFSSKTSRKLKMWSYREDKVIEDTEFRPIIVGGKFIDIKNKFYDVPVASYVQKLMELNGDDVMINLRETQATADTLRYIGAEIGNDAAKALTNML